MASALLQFVTDMLQSVAIIILAISVIRMNRA
jgi:hypothetical protein